jgi:hypothetical protein
VELRTVDLDDLVAVAKNEVSLLAGDLHIHLGELGAGVVQELQRPALGVRAGAVVRDVGVARGQGG